VEIHPVFYRVLSKLRLAESRTFSTVNESVFNYIERHKRFDAALALGIFHHFIKTRSNHALLIKLLSALDMDEMFFWAHNPTEKQMEGAFRNYMPEEFANFIIKYSCLRDFVSIGAFNERILFHMWR
jgi:hypothetical protein